MSHANIVRSKAFLSMLEQVRAICANLPEVTEEIDGFRHTVFRVNGKTFIFTGENNAEDTPAISVKSDRETQELLIAAGVIRRHHISAITAGCPCTATRIGRSSAS